MNRSVLSLLLASICSAAPAFGGPLKRCRVERPRPLGHGYGAGVRPLAEVTLPSRMGFPFLVHAQQIHETLAMAIRDAADLAWQREIVNAGWPAPLPDDDGPNDMLDIYVDDTLGIDEAYVAPETYPLGGFDIATCFMGLAPEFSDPDILASTVFHELNHTSQFALDAFEDDTFFEQTAVFAEIWFAGELFAYDLGIADYQQHPERALDYIGTDFYEYGSALWLLFFAQELGRGDDPVLQLWLDSQQRNGDNEPDFLDVLPDQIGDLRPFFARFALARYFTGSRDDGMHFTDGARWGEISLVPVRRETLIDRTTLSAAIGPFGAAYFELAVDRAQVRIEVSGESAVAAILSLGATEVSVVDGSLDLSLPAGTVLIALTRVPAGYDPDDDDWTAAEVRATFTRIPLEADAGVADAPSIDASPEPEEREEGCSCSTTPASSGSSLLASALAISAMALRRRRACVGAVARRENAPA